MIVLLYNYSCIRFCMYVHVHVHVIRYTNQDRSKKYKIIIFMTASALMWWWCSGLIPRPCSQLVIANVAHTDKQGLRLVLYYSRIVIHIAIYMYMTVHVLQYYVKL